jgi:hypothetical protein
MNIKEIKLVQPGMIKLLMFALAIFLFDTATAQMGMGSFTSNLSGSSGGSGGGTGVPIDGGLLTVVIGSAGYAYKKLKGNKTGDCES